MGRQPRQPGRPARRRRAAGGALGSWGQRRGPDPGRPGRQPRSLDNPGVVTGLLAALREAGNSDAARTPADRAARTASLDDPWAVAGLLAELRKAGHGDAAQTLATRAANAGMFDRFFAPRPNEAVNYRFGRQPGGPNRNPGNGSNPPVEGLPAEIINWRPPYPACREPNGWRHDHRRAPGPGGRRPETVGKDVAKSAFLAIGPGPFVSQSGGVTVPPRPIAPKPSAASSRRRVPYRRSFVAAMAWSTVW